MTRLLTRATAGAASAAIVATAAAFAAVVAATASAAAHATTAVVVLLDANQAEPSLARQARAQPESSALFNQLRCHLRQAPRHLRGSHHPCCAAVKAIVMAVLVTVQRLLPCSAADAARAITSASDPAAVSALGLLARAARFGSFLLFVVCDALFGVCITALPLSLQLSVFFFRKGS